MSQFRYALAGLVAVLAACAQPAVPPGKEFSGTLSQCRQQAWTSCAGSWECEDSLRSRCMAEHGWKKVGGAWQLGQDAQRAREIERELDTADDSGSQPAPVGSGSD